MSTPGWSPVSWDSPSDGPLRSDGDAPGVGTGGPHAPEPPYDAPPHQPVAEEPYPHEPVPHEPVDWRPGLHESLFHEPVTAAPLASAQPTRASRRRRPKASPGAVLAGVLGEILITVGILMGLFVVWQLWWTDVVAGREQDQVVEELGWAAPAGPDLRRTDAPPVMDEPAHGETFATLRVPRWGADYVRPVSQGTTRPDILDVLGIGHYEGTAMPGGIGNFAVAGHRTTYNKPFHLVEDLEIGDPLVVQTEDVWYVYHVTEMRIVMPSEIGVIAPVPNEPDVEPDTAIMTLTTCHPMFSAAERFIVHADFAYWIPTADGSPLEALGLADAPDTDLSKDS